MATTTATLTQPSRVQRPLTTPRRAELESQSGPWLILVGPISIALTVAAVAWISRISF